MRPPGAIKIRSKRPGNSFEAVLRVDLGDSAEDTHPGAGFASRDFEGAVQIPIVDEVLSTRFAFRFKQQDPYAKNGCSTAYVPTQAERQADPVPWDKVPVCGIESFPYRPDNPTPPPNKLQLTVVDPVKPNKVNDQNNWAARGAIRFQPTDTDMDWLFNLHGSRLDQQSTLGQAIGVVGGFGGRTQGNYRDPDIVEMEDRLIAQGLSLADAKVKVGRELARNLDIRPYRGDYDRVGQTKLDIFGTLLRGDMKLGDLDFTTISAYDEYEQHRDTDQDFTALPLFEAIIKDDAWQFSQDLRLKGTLADEAFRWNTGAYYLMEEVHSNTDQIFFLGGTSTANQVWTQKLWSFGIYTGFSWDFLDDFTLEVGGRYNWEEKTFDFTLMRGLNPATGQPNSRTQQDDRIWDAPTGTIVLTYRFTPEVSAFTKVSRGWKGGHFNGSANLLQAIKPAEPETITATETGVKGSFLDARVQAQANFFYYRYENYQVFLFENNLGAPPLLQIVNANDAEVLGAELDVKVKPIEDLVDDLFDGLEIQARVGWLRSQFLDFTQTKIQIIDMVTPIQETVDFSGNPLINSPEWKVNLSVQWPLDFGRYGRVIPRYDGTWTDDIYFDPTAGRGIPNSTTGLTLPEYALGQRAFWLHNLRLAYQTPDGHVELAGWVRNLENTIYKTYAFDASRFSSVIVNFVGQPRTYGMSLSFKY